jgi:hypothetical protein
MNCFLLKYSYKIDTKTGNRNIDKLLSCKEIDKWSFPACNTNGWWTNEENGISKYWIDMSIFNENLSIYDWEYLDRSDHLCIIYDELIKRIRDSKINMILK